MLTRCGLGLKAAPVALPSEAASQPRQVKVKINPLPGTVVPTCDYAGRGTGR